MIGLVAETAGAVVAEEELADLYAALAGRLRQIVAGRVKASDPLIEDACQFAWGRLLRNREKVCRETALGWLVTTAVREAFKLLRRERREIPIEQLADDDSPAAPPPSVVSLEELVEQRERIRTIERLP